MLVPWAEIATRVRKDYAAQPAFHYKIDEVDVEHRSFLTRFASNPFEHSSAHDFAMEIGDDAVTVRVEGMLGERPAHMTFIVHATDDLAKTAVYMQANAGDLTRYLKSCHVGTMLSFALALHAYKHLVQIGHPVSGMFHGYLTSLGVAHPPWIMLIALTTTDDPHLLGPEKATKHLHQLAEILEACGRFKTAAQVYEHVWRAAEQTGARELHAMCLLNAAIGHRRANLFERAEELYCSHMQLAEAPDFNSMAVLYCSAGKPTLGKQLSSSRIRRRSTTCVAARRSWRCARFCNLSWSSWTI